MPPRVSLSNLGRETERLFHRPGWVYEEKYDGYRILAVKEAGQVTLWSRHGKDLTRHYRELAKAIASLPARSITLDGEVAVFDENLVSHLGYRAARGSPGRMVPSGSPSHSTNPSRVL